MRYFFALIYFFGFLPLFSQSFLNGSFEINTARTDQINLSNSALNAMLSGVTAFGSYGDVDIINSSTYGGSGAQDNTWYIAITGAGTDIVALTLSEPLQEGKEYSLSFYDRKNSGHPASNVQIGASETNNAFGTTVYTCNQIPKNNIWTKRICTFIAPNNGKYITVQLAGGDLYHWVNIDNFVIAPTECPKAVKAESSSLTISKGDSVALTASGGVNHVWFSRTIADSLQGKTVWVKPEETSVFRVISRNGSCPVLSANVTVSVNQPVKDPTSTMKQDTANKKTNHIYDSVEVAVVKFKRHSLNGRKIHIQDKIVVKDGYAKLQVWDKNKVDGDIVSIYLNGQLIKENLEVTKTKEEIILHLQSGSNLLVLFAVNMGKIPPNTAAVTLMSGNKSKWTTLVSDFKKSGAVEIIYNDEKLTSR